MSDITFSADIMNKLEAIHPGYAERLKSLGVTFQVLE